MRAIEPSEEFTCRNASLALELDLDVDAGGELEAHKRVHGLGGRVKDVDQALVRADLELLARVLTCPP